MIKRLVLLCSALFWASPLLANPPVMLFQIEPRISGVYTLTANASDVTALEGDLECGLSRVQFFLNDVPLGPPLTAATEVVTPGPVGVTLAGKYTYNWDTTTVPDAQYTIKVIAWDRSGGPTPTVGAECDNSLPNESAPRVVTTVVDNIGNTAPVITGLMPQTVAVGATATFSAQLADDLATGGNMWLLWSSTPAGVVFGSPSYQWSPSLGLFFTTPKGVSTTAGSAPAGTYTISLTANDGEIQTVGTTTLTVTPAAPANVAPVVSMNMPTTVVVGVPVLFGAAVTDDGLPSKTLTYQWAGPGFSFSTPAMMATNATASSPGTFNVTFTASDGQLATTRTIPVIVSAPAPVNTAPVVGPITSRTVVAGTPASFTAVVTDDGLPNKVLTYAWTGPTAVKFSAPAALTTNATATIAGTYTLTFVSSDGALSSAPRTVQLIVTDPVDTVAPLVVINSPSAGNQVAGKLNFKVTASDPSGVAKIELYVNGALVSQVTGGATTLTYNGWNANPYKGRTIIVKALAWDMRNNGPSVHEIQIQVKR